MPLNDLIRGGLKDMPEEYTLDIDLNVLNHLG